MQKSTKICNFVVKFLLKMKNYGAILKEIRILNGKTLLQVEKDTGINNANLSRWENGKVLPNIDFCVQLADYYGISLDELVGRDYERTTKINNQIRDNHGNITFNQR